MFNRVGNGPQFNQTMTTDQLNRGIEINQSVQKMTDFAAQLRTVQEHFISGTKIRLVLIADKYPHDDVKITLGNDSDGAFLISTPLNMLIDETQRSIDRLTTELAAL